MSSPKHRPILSPKHSNSRSSSPIKNDKRLASQHIESPYNNQRIRLSYNHTNTSPSRTNQKKYVSPKKPHSPNKLGFAIFEDAVYYRDTLVDDDRSPDTETKGKENDDIHAVPELCNKLNHDDQENILQPLRKQHTLKQAGLTRRMPLSNLNINEYAGYVTYNQFPVQLNELYQPPNYQNEQKSTHKFNAKLPCFVTPPRSDIQRLTSKYLVKSTIEEEPFNEEDEVELRLTQKQNAIKKRRSLSVGKNDSKFKLIKKNNFLILSN